MVCEIERKWLVKDRPSLHGVEGEQIHQGYLLVTADGNEVRVRQRGGRFSLTIKSSGSLARNEMEIELTRMQFVKLWDVAKEHSIEKVRYELDLGSLVAELDVYGGGLSGLVVVEVEFPSIADSESFNPPSWFGSEVTMDADYKNRNLAMDGLPGGYT